MTIEKINDLLQALQSKPGEESVMEIAYALMDWMKIERAERPKPIQPSTERLRGYLQTRKVFKQPDLVDLSAPGQTMSVRMGSLKKIQKNSMHFLVDKSPGMSAWQNEPPVIRKMSAKPYMVHFVTDARYDRLLLVLHQNGQKRIMTLRARLSQTQYNRILKELKDIALIQSKYEIQEKAWKSMDLKEVNKLFYKEVKVRYDALVAKLAPEPSSKKKEEESEKTTEAHKQFAVRLIGRYIFCWFLKEKEIIAPELISSKAIESTPDFFNRVLRVLFFQVLNKQPYPKRELPKDVPTDLLPHFHRIPYLNGGLFDPSEEDKMFASLELNDWLHNFVKNVLEEYDFTVDESSPSYQQIAIDPEMLGRIFENLLASINPETEKLANERKAFGAFYTPREIVEYMVDQSLRTYLETHLLPPDEYQDEQEIEPSLVKEGPINLFSSVQPKQLSLGESADVEKRARKLLREGEQKKIREKLDKLFTGSADDKLFNEKEADEIRRLLNNCKVLDPACGSGAFPMGMLYRLEELHEAIGVTESQEDLRLKILSNNIFGVDIMPMAVDISRLRAWLAIVLVCDYKKGDVKHNFGVSPLPNLDFKFVCANTLIDVPEDEYVNRMAHAELEEFEILTHRYFAAKFQEKEEIKVQIQNCLNAIAGYHQKAIQQVERSLEDGSGKRSKTKHTKGKQQSLESLMKHYETQKKQWESYTHIFENKPVGFFKTKYFFPSAETGFEVVIGNPPYVRNQQIDKTLKAYYSERYDSATGNYDCYVLFDERGMEFLHKDGNLIYIQPNKFINAEYGTGWRDIASKGKWIWNVVDFQAEQIFNSATTYTCIVHCTKRPNKDLHYTSFKGDNLTESFNLFASGQTSSQIVSASTYSYSALNKSSWSFNDNALNDIFKRMEDQSTPLSDLTEKIFQGLVTSADPVYILQGSGDEYYSKILDKKVNLETTILKPLLKGSEIRRYKIDYQNLYMIFPYRLKKGKDAILLTQSQMEAEFPMTWKYLLDCESKLRNREDGKMDHDRWYAYVYPKNLELFEESKIMTQVLANRASMVFDKDEKFYFVGGGNAGGYGITLKKDANLSHEYLLALLNSSLLDCYLQNHSSRFQNDYFSYAKRFLEILPIKIASNQKPFGRLTSIITILNKTIGYESQARFFDRLISAMVFELYFPEEVKAANCEVLKYVDKEKELCKEAADKLELPAVQKLYQELNQNNHPINKALFGFDTIEQVRIIENKKLNHAMDYSNHPG